MLSRKKETKEKFNHFLKNTTTQKMYTLLVCADLYGDKANLELTFPNMPTISELQRKIVETFNAEAAVKRPSGYPNIEFHIARIQIYDDVLLKWADLVTCTQLHEYDQLYVFQPQSPWHIDVQKDLPPPRPPSQLMPSGSVQNSLAYGSHHNNNSAVGGYSSAGRGTQHQNNNSNISHTSGSGNSPSRERLLAQKQREEQLRAELERTHQETMRLEEEARREEEMMARRGASDQEEILRRKELEIERQRAALMQAEEEYRRARGGR